MTPDWWVKCTLEESRYGLIKVMSRDFLGGTKDHQRFQSGQLVYLLSFLWRFGPIPGNGLPYWVGYAITLIGHTTLGRTHLDEWLARRKDLYLTTHNTHKRNIHVPSEIRTHNPIESAAANARLRQCGHLDRQLVYLPGFKFGTRMQVVEKLDATSSQKKWTTTTTTFPLYPTSLRFGCHKFFRISNSSSTPSGNINFVYSITLVVLRKANLWFTWCINPLYVIFADKAELQNNKIISMVITRMPSGLRKRFNLPFTDASFATSLCLACQLTGGSA